MCNETRYRVCVLDSAGGGSTSWTDDLSQAVAYAYVVFGAGRIGSCRVVRVEVYDRLLRRLVAL